MDNAKMGELIRDSRKETCKLNNLDLFVKMPKPPLRTAFEHA